MLRLGCEKVAARQGEQAKREERVGGSEPKDKEERATLLSNERVLIQGYLSWSESTKPSSLPASLTSPASSTSTWNTFSPIRELWFVVCRRSIVIVFTLWMNFKGNSTLFWISATLHDQRGEVVLGKEEGAELLIFIERFSRSNGIIQELL